VGAGTDPNGQLSMTVVSEKELGKCGGFKHVIKWEMDQGFPRKGQGYIVQKVCYSDNTKPCKEGGRIDCTPIKSDGIVLNKRDCPEKCYIEAWRVDGEHIGTNTKDRPGVKGKTDVFSKPNCPNTYGDFEITGEAIFIPLEFVQQNPQLGFPGNVYQGELGVTRASFLFSACWNDPGIQNFWNVAFEAHKTSSTFRKSSSTWWCCDKLVCFNVDSEYDNFPIAPGEPPQDSRPTSQTQ
jgi:hypothetical protein